MTTFVVDASVAVKWFLSEPHSDAAVRLLLPEHRLIAPELVFSEVTHTLLKRCRSGEIQHAQAVRALTELTVMIRIRPAAHLTLRALDLAALHDRSAYDAIYVALAIEQDCPMITADRRLYNALHSALPDTMLWVEDLPHPAD